MTITEQAAQYAAERGITGTDNGCTARPEREEPAGRYWSARTDSSAAAEAKGTTMETYEVRFSVRVPDEVAATREEVEAWLRFELHATGELSLQNPLQEHCPIPMRGTFRVMPTAGFRE